MAILTREKEVPQRLPAARLYLDDIEQIQKVILDIASSRPTQPEREPTYYEIKTTFSVGDQICTEFHDLQKVGKESRNFEMTLDSEDIFAARFSVDDGGVHWWVMGLGTGDKLRIFHAIETIIKRRRLWRDRLVPPEFRSLFILFTSFLLSTSLAYTTIALSKKILSTHSEYIFIPACLLAGIFPVFVLWRFMHSSEAVILRFSWEQAERREDRNTKIAIGAVIAFIAFILGVLKQKFWP